MRTTRDECEQGGRCLSVAPIMPTTDIAQTKRHYERLGFTVDVLDDFVMTKRDGSSCSSRSAQSMIPSAQRPAFMSESLTPTDYTSTGGQPAFLACDSCATPTTICVSLLTSTPTAT